MDIIFATGNQHKVIEANKALGNSFTLIMPKDLGLNQEIPETGDTIQANAIEKCKFLWDKFHKTCFADDTGLEVDALNGAPGVYTARYAGESKTSQDNMDKLLSELAKQEKIHGKISRKARFRTVIAIIINNECKTFEGILNGEIALQKSGTEGFGYDPIFIPDGYSKTLAEISLDQKNAISHRGKALRNLKEYLECLQKVK